MQSIDHQLLHRATAASDPEIPLKTIFIFAHHDDETVGLGARLARYTSGLLLHVTDGAPANMQDSRDHGFDTLAAYRSARQSELDDALHTAGAPTLQRECMGLPDQEASLHLADLTQSIIELLRTHTPEVIFTHPYEGGHPDHDACAFAVQHAVEVVRSTDGQHPLVIEAAFYHMGPHGIETGCFLGAASDSPELRYDLSSEEEQRKRQMFSCFKTQQQTLQYFSSSHEVFRAAPRYDFAMPPHDGPVFYDRFPWGMTSQRFCELATTARESLMQQQEYACR